MVQVNVSSNFPVNASGIDVAYFEGIAKNLLPYNVTPPRPAGPTEAERKIEELTRQLEEEIERSEEQGEYFGKNTRVLLPHLVHCLYRSSKISNAAILI